MLRRVGINFFLHFFCLTPKFVPKTLHFGPKIRSNILESGCFAMGGGEGKSGSPKTQNLFGPDRIS